MADIGELLVSVKQEGADDVSSDVKDSAQEGVEDGGSGLMSILGSSGGLGALIGGGAILGILGSMESIQSTFGAFMDLAQAYFVPMAQGFISLAMPLFRLLAKLLPKWLSFMQNPITGNVAADTLIKGSIGVGALITGTLAISALISGTKIAISSLITGSTLSSITGGSLAISGGLSASSLTAAGLTVGGVAISGLVAGAVAKGITDYFRENQFTGETEPTIGGGLANIGKQTKETVNPAWPFSGQDMENWLRNGGQNLSQSQMRNTSKKFNLNIFQNPDEFKDFNITSPDSAEGE